MNFKNGLKRSVASMTLSVALCLLFLAMPGFTMAESSAPDSNFDLESGHDFYGVTSFIDEIEVSRIVELSPDNFRFLVLDATPRKLRNRLKKYFPIVIKYAAKYSVDPFWVLAIMWTESHFRQKAVSPVKARGVMQIMPATGRYLAKILKDRPISIRAAVRMIKDPEVNIEMGVFYLKKLLKMFDYDHNIATVAYNMGPGWASRRLRTGRPIAVRNKYLNKVRRAYVTLTKRYREYFENMYYIYELPRLA